MKFSLRELAEMVDGKIQEGASQDIEIAQISPIESALEGSLTFLHNSKYIHHLYSTKASAVLVSADFVPEKKDHPILVKVDDVYARLVLLLEKFNHVTDRKKGIEEPVYVADEVQLGENIYLGAFTYIGKGSKIGKNVKIYPNCYIGENVTVKDNTVLFAGVKIYSDCEIGKHCILHSGCVVGSDGFGHALQEDGSYKKVPQMGNVIVGDHVEIGANTTIDRATIESTVIQEGVKLDNLIQIAHNVEIGSNTVISSQSGISGSTKIGKGCMIGGQVGFANHLEIAEGSKFGAQSGVAQSIHEKNATWFGTPVQPIRDTLRLYNIQKKLPELYRQLNEMAQEIKNLKSDSK